MIMNLQHTFVLKNSWVKQWSDNSGDKSFISKNKLEIYDPDLPLNTMVNEGGRLERLLRS